MKYGLDEVTFSRTWNAGWKAWKIETIYLWVELLYEVDVRPQIHVHGIIEALQQNENRWTYLGQ